MAHTYRREARQIKRDGVAGRIASGNHLVAQNDEAEPFTEQELIEADLTYLHGQQAREERRLREAHQLDVDAMRRAGL